MTGESSLKRKLNFNKYRQYCLVSQKSQIATHILIVNETPSVNRSRQKTLKRGESKYVMIKDQKNKSAQYGKENEKHYLPFSPVRDAKRYSH